MLFYFHFLYSFPFNVISVATVLCFCGFHPPVVFTLPWFPPSLWFPPFHGFHPVWLLCGLHPPVICIFPWLLVVSLLWFALSWFTLCHGFHPPVVCIFAWFPPCLWLLCGVPSVVCTLWFTLCHGFHPPMVCIFMWFPPSLWLLHGVPFVVCTIMVYTLPWFPPSRGLHLHVVPTLPVVTLWCPFHGLHHHVVYTLPWFPPSRGYSVVSILDFGLN